SLPPPIRCRHATQSAEGPDRERSGLRHFGSSVQSKDHSIPAAVKVQPEVGTAAPSSIDIVRLLAWIESEVVALRRRMPTESVALIKAIGVGFRLINGVTQPRKTNGVGVVVPL